METNAVKGDTPLARLQDLLPQIFSPGEVEGALFLKIQILPDIVVALSLSSIEEVTLVNVDDITLIPNMPEAAMGLINARGNVFWLIDLATMLGFRATPEYRQAYEMIMLRIAPDSSSPMGGIDSEPKQSDGLIGLSVNHVQGSFRISSTDICPIDESLPLNIPVSISHCVQFYILQGNTPLFILDTNALVSHLAHCYNSE